MQTLLRTCLLLAALLAGSAARAADTLEYPGLGTITIERHSSASSLSSLASCFCSSTAYLPLFKIFSTSFRRFLPVEPQSFARASMVSRRSVSWEISLAYFTRSFSADANCFTRDS